MDVKLDKTLDTKLPKATSSSPSKLPPPSIIELLKKKESLYTAASIIGGLLIVVLIGYFFIFPRNTAETDNNENTPEVTDTPSPLASATPTPEAETDKNRIAFITANNVWVVNPDASGKTQITTDGGASARYSSLDWKAPGLLSYVKCTSSCAVVTYSFADKKENVEVDIPNSQSAYISWNRDGTMLGYYVLSSVGDNANFILHNNSGTVSIKTFEFPGGRGASNNDDLSIYFSPDNSKVVYTNTFFGDETIYVYDMTGKQLTAVKAHATFGRMMNSSSILYVDKETLLQRSLSDNKVTSVGKHIGYDLIPGLDNEHYYFWKLNEKSGIVSLYWNKLGGTEQKITENFLPIEPISNNEVAGYLTKPVTAIGESMLSYDISGLGKVSNDGKARVTLHSGQVFEVAVE
ncbi:MAG: DPP IV N-terminal domain-containing protein [Candidatus Dojkabacteria bacterium]|nr:MAG: DPP IV N-terminal domain-containing protein [Candidatus Dojkabacteria bacterium]